LKSMAENKKIHTKLFRIISACKKTLLTVLVLAVAAFSFLPVNAYAAGTDKVTIFIKVNKEVVKTPDLYEHLTLTLKTADNEAGTGAVLVLESKMNTIGTGAIPIGEFDAGKRVYIFFDITLDGASTPNTYQGSEVKTSYSFSTQSGKKLVYFHIKYQTGDAFENMINLNPGDHKFGKVCLDIGNATEATTNKPETTTKHHIPKTNDPAPLNLLIGLSVTFTVLLGLQIVFLKKSKNKGKTETNE